jgi:hypothetical protein
VFSQGKALRKVPTSELVDTLFSEIDKYVSSRRVDVDVADAAEGAAFLAEIEAEHADELTPERIAALEAQAARLSVDESPVAGRRFTRA